MLMEASGHTNNRKARLISPQVVSSQSVCLYFYYYMYGNTVRKLSIYTKMNNNLGRAVWSKQGNQGQNWQIAMVTLTTTGQPYNVSKAFVNVKDALFFIFLTYFMHDWIMTLDLFNIFNQTLPSIKQTCWLFVAW